MRIFLTLLVTVFLLAAFSLAEGGTITARKTEEAPVIDGRIEELWGEPVIPYLTISLPHSKAGEVPDNKTRVYILYDEAYLYLAFACEEEDREGLVTDKMERDGPWGDDGLEIFLDPGRTKHSYYQVFFNAKGISTDFQWLSRHHGIIEWDSGTLVKTRKGEKGWSAEVRIPWADFAADTDITGPWGINFNRWEPRKRIGQSWAPLIGSFHQPDRFGILKVDLARYSLRMSDLTFGALSFGNNILSAKIKNEGKEHSKIAAEVKWQISGEEPGSIIEYYSLKPGEAKRVSLNYLLKGKGRRGRIVFRVFDPKDDFCYLQKVKYFTIPSSLLTLKMEPVFFLSDSQADLKVKLNLGDADRKKSLLLITVPEVKEKTSIPSPSSELTIPLDISQLGVGEYKILVELLDPQNNLLQSQEITFTRLKSPF